MLLARLDVGAGGYFSALMAAVLSLGTRPPTRFIMGLVSFLAVDSLAEAKALFVGAFVESYLCKPVTDARVLDAGRPMAACL